MQILKNEQVETEGVDIGKQINNFWHPQLVSLILVFLILVIFAFVIYFKVRKQDYKKAPEGILLITEAYVVGVNNLYKENLGGKVKKMQPYAFTLLTFLLVANTIGIFGFESPITSYAVPLTLAVISVVTIWVIAVAYQKMKYVKQFINPLNIIGAVTPIISLSLRLFGNIIAGSTIMYLLFAVTGSITSYIPVIGEVNFLGAIVAPAFHLYFDVFGGVVQAYVFTLLTVIFWSNEAVVPEEVTKVKKVNK